MSSVVIASNYQGSQAVAQWFITNRQFIANDVTKLGNGDTLVIAAHDVELGDANKFLASLPQVDLSKSFDILLIVCSAQTLDFTKGIATPAETIANHFKKPVKAAKGTVTATIGADLVIKGDYQTVNPGTDVTSLMGTMSIKH